MAKDRSESPPHAVSSSSSLSMIFERMSEECIGSLVTAQSESARLAQPSVGCEVMTIGVIDRPERARKTLKSYGITLRKAKLTVENMFRDEASGDNCEEKENRGIFITRTRRPATWSCRSRPRSSGYWLKQVPSPTRLTRPPSTASASYCLY
mmetsp:Transcript_37911/g.80986  ORF Transcript_37911/g.80986 Transcript_37911/m.80986 type:complete len:152 (+) Transcript_37911:813-1268(+)